MLPLLRFGVVPVLLAVGEKLPFPADGTTLAPISLAASCAVSVIGLPLRLAFCTRAAEVGDGGRGGGFMA